MKQKKNKLIILIFIISLVIFLGVFYINSKIVLNKEEIITTLSIGDKAGFDTNTTALTFGMIKEGSTSSRNLLIENDYDFPIKIEFRVEGDIKKFLVFDENVYLDSWENKTISIAAIDFVGEEYRNYSGKFIITTKRNLWGVR